MFGRQVSEFAGKVSDDDVRWAYRALLQREPEGEAAIAHWRAAAPDLKSLMSQIISSPEFRAVQMSRLDVPDSLKLFFTKTRFDVFQPVNIGIEGEIKSYAIYDYETEESDFVNSSCSEGQSVVDLGARHGWFTGIMAKRVGPTGNVYAFEPDIAFHYVQSLIEANNFKCVRLLRVAASDTNGTICFDSLIASMGSGPAVVETARLDDVLRDRTSQISFMKIDIEGAEFRALTGAIGILQTDRPRILIELGEEQQQRVSGVSAMEPIGLLERVGYQAKHFDGSPFPKSEIARRVEAGDVFNLRMDFA